MSLDAVLTIQGGVLIACASAIVALVRTRGTVAAMTFAVLASLACTSALLWSARTVLTTVELPPEVVRRVVLDDLLYAALPVAAMTIAAMVLARRPSRPSALSHWTIVVVMGLIAWPLAMALERWIGVDVITAVA